MTSSTLRRGRGGHRRRALCHMRPVSNDERRAQQDLIDYQEHVDAAKSFGVKALSFDEWMGQSGRGAF